MRSKLTLMLLTTSLVSATTVGGVAYWMLVSDFHQKTMDAAFLHFQEDVREYIRTYGSWENTAHREHFHHFVQRRRRNSMNGSAQPVTTLGMRIERGNVPPFRFLLLNPAGVVLQGIDGYRRGAKVSGETFKHALPIVIDGKTAVLAVPVGQPQLTPSDLSYLTAVRNSLMFGFAVAVLLAFIIGIAVGRRFTKTISDLTKAIRAMQSDNNRERYVSDGTNDELGELAAEFNRMNHDLVQTHRELLEMSIRDPLTNLFNRRHFDNHANTLFEQAIRYGHPLSIMVGDLDHFKQINDNFSHDIGDKVLKQVAKILCAGTRKSDLVARYGGEEFVILFANTGASQALTRCEQLRSDIEHYPWSSLHPELFVTMSMGLSDNLTEESVEKIISVADRGLYAAKNAGRNRIVFVPDVTEAFFSERTQRA